MLKYLIDANLPYYFSLWDDEEYVHQKDIDPAWSDTQIWEYAKTLNLTIITKDTDFSNRIIISQPPPRVIHIKFGNMKMKDFYIKISSVWEEVIKLSDRNKLVNVFYDKIETIK